MNLIPRKNREKAVQNRDSASDFFAPMAAFRNELDNMMQRFWNEPWGGGWDKNFLDSWNPLVDMKETDKEVLLSIETPGVDPKDVELSLSDRTLTIRGEKKEESEKTEGNYYHTERRYGSFSRTLELPAEIDHDNITAEHVNGVLKIKAKKLTGSSVKKIPINSR